MDILEKLWYDNAIGDKTRMNEDYKNSLFELECMYKKIEKTLSDDALKAFKNYDDYIYRLVDIAALDAFKRGFGVCVSLMTNLESDI